MMLNFKRNRPDISITEIYKYQGTIFFRLYCFEADFDKKNLALDGVKKNQTSIF